MDKSECIEDFQQLKEELVEYLSRISKAVENIVFTIEENNISILNDVDKVSKELSEVESVVSTYFLNSLLSEYTNFTHEISRAIHKLSIKGHGALIVIEKSDPVVPHIEEGTPVHARISSPLLESIFNPESQLHHGAVYIKEDSIISASNVLPTSKEVFWNRMFDIREMSAVGLSERCDALILIVSEMGSSSFCIGGNLYPFTAT